MDKPHPSTNLPGRLSMLGLLCSLLLLVSLCASGGESRTPAAQEGTPDVGGADGQRVLLLEAVKTGILGSLGMDREPRPTRKASEEELRRMYETYREKVTEMRGNSSQPTRETTSAVLLPSTVEPIKAVWRGDQRHDRRKWYRAVFHKNPNIQTEVSLARAELKVSRQILDKPTSAQSALRRDIQVKVNRMKPMNFAAARTRVNSPIRADASGTRGVTLDIGPEARRWMRTGAGAAPLVVDVGILEKKDALEENPTISLELGLTKAARKTRLPRSNKEDECDERGWCCRKSVTVSFKDIGWTDWVVAPAEYTMHFCDGTCPHNYKPASMHTQVKSRLHQITKGGSPRPCCVPAAYEPMVLMHYDSRGKLKLTPFQDLIVSKCHCA